jgi:hypothetical protein
MSLFGKHDAMPEDMYVKMQKQMMAMPKDQMMTKMMEMGKMCTCPSCPSYNDCAKTAMETMFCGKGMSFHCIREIKGCICPTCPVAKQMGLTHQAFCAMGNEKTQRFGDMLKV